MSQTSQSPLPSLSPLTSETEETFSATTDNEEEQESSTAVVQNQQVQQSHHLHKQLIQSPQKCQEQLDSPKTVSVAPHVLQKNRHAAAVHRTAVLCKKRRWDQNHRGFTSSANLGKKTRRTYRSWRRYKADILESLVVGSRNAAFARRYMLFCKGVNLPKGIIHYYNSRYYSRAALQNPDL